MRLLALRITASTYRGTLLGIPNLIALLRRYDAGATFLLSLGPDHSGRAVKRLFRHGSFKQARRTHAAAHYGLSTLLTGTLLPTPQIGRRTANVLRGIQDAGFEVGVQAWDRLAWEDKAAYATPAWTE